MTEEEFRQLLEDSINEAHKSGYVKALNRIMVFRDNLIPYVGKVPGTQEAILTLNVIIEGMEKDKDEL